ncbi:MAG: hypothetical protein QGH24_00840, partial [Candidatus Marinimicrobia bacterium]|nr:hypothetical protein [Candidatus Neomarinimicrobiota bacterium]
MVKTIFTGRRETGFGICRIVLLWLVLSIPILAQFQGGENAEREPQYNVSSERFFTDQSGTILMNVNVWGHVNLPGRHMVFDGIDLA